MEWREEEGVRWLEADLGGAKAAFSTRLGGVSDAPFDTLNLGLLTDDEPEAVRANRERLARALGLDPSRIFFARQVHGTRLLEHRTAAAPWRGSFRPESDRKVPRDASALLADVPEADGHVLRAPGAAALAFAADCLPVALRGPDGVAIVHAGWRGLAGGILAAGVAAVGAKSAAIGPGIGACCYEVGDEVLEAFASLGEGVATGRMLDLPEAARRLLVAAGVERVESAGICTSCESELFFSHRRDAGRTGRQGGLAWIDAEDADG
jgi:YfiH family protein